MDEEPDPQAGGRGDGSALDWLVSFGAGEDGVTPPEPDPSTDAEPSQGSPAPGPGPAAEADGGAGRDHPAERRRVGSPVDHLGLVPRRPAPSSAARAAGATGPPDEPDHERPGWIRIALLGGGALMAVGVVFGVLRLADPGSDASSDGAAQGRSDAPTATAEEPGARAVGPYFDDNLTAGQADLLEYLAPHGYPLRYDGPATFDPSGDPEEAAAQVALLIMVAENTGFSEEDQAALSFPYTYDPSRPNFIAPNTDDDGDIKPPKDVVLTRLSDGGARLTFVFEAFYANKDQRDAVVNLIEGHFGGGPGQGVVEIAVDVEFDAAGRLAGGTSWRGIN